MNRIDELNEAIATLSEECANQEECKECTLFDGFICKLACSPWRWKKLEQKGE